MAASSNSYIMDMALSSSVIRLPVLLKGGDGRIGVYHPEGP